MLISLPRQHEKAEADAADQEAKEGLLVAPQGLATITVRVAELDSVKELLADIEQLVRAASDFDNAVARFGLRGSARAVRDSYQVVHDRLHVLRLKYPKTCASER